MMVLVWGVKKGWERGGGVIEIPNGALLSRRMEVGGLEKRRVWSLRVRFGRVGRGKYGQVLRMHGRLETT